MARKAVKKKPPKKGFRIGLTVSLAAAAVLALTAGGMYWSARTLHVRYAEVYLEDLPASFNGTTVLYASDIDLCGTNTARVTKRTFDQLQSLKPDILLLGGDFSSPSILERLNGEGEGDQEARKEFFLNMSNFYAPMGKFAVSSTADGDLDALRLTMVPSGVKLIDGTCEVITNGTDAIGIVGVGAETDNLPELARGIRADQCALVLLHSPDCVTEVRISEAKDGGAWADLILAGHTHGGQIQLGGRSVLTLTDTEKRYMSGWYTEGSPLLVSQGMGCEGVNLRLNSQAEVWLLTLRTR